VLISLDAARLVRVTKLVRWSFIELAWTANDAREREPMGLTDRIKDLRKKAADAAVEHDEQIHQALQRAASTADERTGGKYHEQIQKAGVKADSFLDSIKDGEQQGPGPETAGGESEPAAS
jgi:hypothetical protein